MKMTMTYSTRKDLEQVLIDEAVRQQNEHGGEVPEWWKAVDVFTASDTEVSILFCEVMGY